MPTQYSEVYLATAASSSSPGGLIERPKARMAELDALRGLAALSVVLYHFVMMFWGEEIYKVGGGSAAHLSLALALMATLRIFYGHEAVILFFLLSGFVLSLPWLHGKGQPYPVFVCRRVFRIYFPYLAALALAVAGNCIWHGPLGRGPWADQTWLHPVDWNLVWQHVLFIGEYPPAVFNTAFWSLPVEMRASLVFPLLFLLAMRLRDRKVLLLPVCLGCSGLRSALLHWRHSEFLSTATTIQYIGAFLIGILLASYRTEIRDRLASWNGRSIVMFLCCSLFIYGYGGAIVSKYSGSTGEWVSATGGAGIICLSIGWAPMTAFLHWRIPQFLGQISYSTYLVHGTILFALTYSLGSKISHIEFFGLYISLVILFAWCMYHAVEKPCMEYGRRLSLHLIAQPVAA